MREGGGRGRGKLLNVVKFKLSYLVKHFSTRPKKPLARKSDCRCNTCIIDKLTDCTAIILILFQIFLSDILMTSSDCSGPVLQLRTLGKTNELIEAEGTVGPFPYLHNIIRVQDSP